jgi:hypothetical protein
MATGRSPSPTSAPAAPGSTTQTASLVLKDPGQVRVAFDIDYNGTPGNPDDDVEVPDSFRIVRASTGNSDFSNRDFCADLVNFTGCERPIMVPPCRDDGSGSEGTRIP